MSRRRFLALGGTASVLGIGLPLGHRAGVAMLARQSSRIRSDPFTLGVASGDPWPDSVVLWTRLLPADPDDAHAAGLSQRPYEVDWLVATTSNMVGVERRGSSWAIPELGHAVHITVEGLRPGREYWYRFKSGPWLSPIGRTKTAPAPGQATHRLDLAVASCQRWDAGFYTVHRHLAADTPDAVVFLGDYIYEVGMAPPNNGRGRLTPMPERLASEATTLEDYRARYAWYKRDPDLQAAHHVAPWIATWDDHEVANNYAAAISEQPTSRASFAARRAAAYQAYWEHLPLRSRAPTRSALRMHRRLSFGSLADLHVLDTRQYRSDQVAGDAWQHTTPERTNPNRTMLGDRQERWLHGGLRTSNATWNLVAQQVIAGRLRIDSGDDEVFNVDTWDGYPVAQQRLCAALANATNPVVLTGDLHAGYALDIANPIDTTGAAIVAAEFAATSVSSGGDGTDLSPAGKRLLDANPHLHFASQRRGYLRCRLTPHEMTVDFRTVPYVTDTADAPVSTARTFVVEAGTPGILDH